VHGERGEALTGKGEMEGEVDKGKKEEALEPIMMDEYQIKWIMETTGKMCSGVPYQYKVNTKKRVVDMRECLESDEEVVDYIQVVEQTEKIMCMKYERNMRGPRVEIEGNTPIHISVIMEPINPCATNTLRRTPPCRKLDFGRRKTIRSTYTQGTTNGGASSRSIIQVSTPCRGSSLAFRMA
jgi:hypothetical protein